jgi:hypothetical protein
MKRYVLLFLALMLLRVVGTTQTIYQSSFEAFNAGDFLAVVDPNWTTWSSLPGSTEDAVISTDHAFTGTKSVMVTGSTDAVLPMSNYTQGVFNVSFQMYVPTGYYGYFNLLQLFAGASSEWGMQVFFDTGGQGSIDGGAQAAATFTYQYDTWMLIENIIDLDNDWAEFYINGSLIHGWVWSTGSFGTGTLKQLGGMDMYAWAENGPPLYYFDDVKFEAATSALYEDDFESYTLGSYLAVSNPTWWTTWSGAPGGTEDAKISNEQSLSPTQSVKVDGVTDLILKLGDKTSGKYEVVFHYFIPTGYGAYYNFQHFESPGIEWAFEVYFGATGSAYLNAGGNQVANFNFPHDQWITLDNIIDLDKDSAVLKVDNVQIYKWQYSLQASGGAGTKQLGGIDFYAGAPTGETPMYYFDDLVFSELQGGIGPAIIGVTPSSLSATLAPGTTTTQTLSIDNSGETDLTFDILVTYPGDYAFTPIPENNLNGKMMPFGSTLSVAPDQAITNAQAAPTDDQILHYDGDPYTGVGLTNGGTFRCAAMFPAAMVQPYIGMKLTSVEIYTWDQPVSTVLKIYDMGSPIVPGPGALIYEQTFTGAATTWNTVTLTTPITVTGVDLWVGYEVDAAAGIYPAGADIGPANANGDWISSGPGWSHLATQGLDYNWNIRAHLTGTAIEQWLSVNPATGTVTPGQSQNITATFDATNLTTGNYSAELIINNNDPNNPQVIVPVTLGVTTGIDENQKVSISMFPNPAGEVLYITSDVKIQQVTLFNNVGQMVLQQNANNTMLTLRVSDLEPGIYFVKIKSESDVFTHRVAIE